MKCSSRTVGLVSSYVSYRLKININEWTVLVFAGLLLSAAAFLNGYPLVYPDTGMYLTQSLELEGAPERPPYYALLIFPFHLGLSLRLIPVVQGTLAAYLILRALECIIPGMTKKHFLMIVTTLTIGTSLPWFTSQVMPDVFAAAAVLNIFILALHPNLGRAERPFVCLLLTISVAVHFSHFVIAVSTVAALLAVSLRRTGTLSVRRGRIALEVGAAVTLSLIAFALYNYALIGRPVLSAMSPIFLLARSLEDGPARQYLEIACPHSRWLLCRRQKEIPPTSDAFLWEASSPIQDLYRERKWDETLKEASEIVSGAVSAYPGWQLRQALRNFLRQLVMINTGDFDFDYRRLDLKINRVMRKHFPDESQAFLSSAQVGKTIPLNMIVPFHNLIAALAFTYSCFAAVKRWREGHSGTPALFVAVVLAFASNAFMTGVLSGPAHRYGSRMGWLMMLAAIALFAAGTGRRRPEAAG